MTRGSHGEHYGESATVVRVVFLIQKLNVKHIFGKHQYLTLIYNLLYKLPFYIEIFTTSIFTMVYSLNLSYAG